MMTRDEMKSQLHSGVYEIHFIKADGSIRVMRCTLMEEFLPAPLLLTEDGSEPQKKRLENEDVLPVWDLQENGWRSFRLDSVFRVERI